MVGVEILFPTLFEIQFGSFFFNIRATNEAAFMILFACAILFHIAQWIEFLYLCDFMRFSLGMPSSEALENFEKCGFTK